MTETEDRIRRLLKQPQDLQLVKMWAAVENIMDNMNIQSHINAHRCQFGIAGSQGTAKFNQCPKLKELKLRYMEHIEAYKKIISELDSEFKRQLSGV